MTPRPGAAGSAPEPPGRPPLRRAFRGGGAASVRRTVPPGTAVFRWIFMGSYTFSVNLKIFLWNLIYKPSRL